MIGTAAHFDLWGKDQSVGIDRAIPRSATQIFLRQPIADKEPENAIINFREQSHPYIENWRRNLRRIVETTKHKAIVRQTDLLARRHALGNRPKAMRLIAAWQMHDPFGEERLLVERQDNRVRKAIIEKSRTGSPRKSKVTYLDRRRAITEYFRPAFARMSRKIDSDIDLKLSYPVRDVAAVQGTNIVKPIERPGHAATHIALVIGAK